MLACVCVFVSTGMQKWIPARELQVIRFVNVLYSLGAECWWIGHEPQFNGCRRQNISQQHCEFEFFFLFAMKLDTQHCLSMQKTFRFRSDTLRALSIV